ncbi:CPBP family intramembrane glutamic endopeptidase [Ideonella sp. YS5]
MGLFFAFGPMLAALIATFVNRRTPGVVALSRRVFAWRVPLVWYLVALVIPTIPQWLGIGTWSAVDGMDLDLTPWTVWLSRWVQISIFGGLFSVGEELGWRGFMLPRVQEGRSWLSASLIVGLLSTVWHYPIWFFGAWAATGSVAKAILLIAIASVGAVGMSVLVTWIFNHSRHSVLPAMLFHGSANANMNIFYGRLREE